MAVSRPPRRAGAESRPARPSFLQRDAAPPAEGPLWTRLAWALMALFGAALVIMMATVHRIGDIYTETDFYGAYGFGARMIEHGHFDPARYAVVGPVHEVALALVGFVVHDLFVAGELLSAAAMCVATLLWFRVARERAGSAAAFVTVIFLVTNGTWFRYGYSATTDALALALQAVFVTMLLTGQGTPRRVFATGVLACLAFLTRYNAVVLLPAGLIVILAGGTSTPSPGRRRAALLFTAGFFALLAPWLGYALTHGAHAGIQLHHNVAYEVFARSKGLSWDNYEQSMQSQFPTPWSVFARDPSAVTLHMFYNFFDHMRLDAIVLTGWPLALTAMLGAALAVRTALLPRLAPVLAITLLLFFTLVPAFHSERYSLSVLPGWALLAGVAVASPRFAFAFDAGGGRRVWLKAILALVPIALSLQLSVALQKLQARLLPVEALQIVREAKPLLRPGDRVIARKSYFAWHAGLDAVPFPFADSLAQLAAAAKREHARWLYFSWPEAELRPEFAYLLDTANVVPGLVPRAVTRHYPAVLYEIMPGFGAEPAWAASDTMRMVARARAYVLIRDNDWKSRLFLALHEQRLGRYEAAQHYLDQAVRLAPEDLGVLLPLGDNLVHTDHAAAARDVYLHAERIEPGNADARLGLGWATLLMGDAPQAAELWRPVVSLAEDAATLQRMLQLYAYLKDQAGAEAVRTRMRELRLLR